MDSLQFYSTPPSLAKYAFDKFQFPIKKLLEPSAGHGDLLKSVPSHYRGKVDCIEVDFSRSAVLEKKGFPVVGHDFLEFNGISIYSHIFLNPPFAMGVEHVLHAWDILFDGEVVAIVNAETIKNPNSKKKRFLVDLVSRFGSVEFLQEQFMSEDAERKTQVEVAVIYLCKQAECSFEFIGNLESDSVKNNDFLSLPHEVSVPMAKFQGYVFNFDCAVEAARRSAKAAATAEHYGAMLGKSILDADPSANKENPNKLKDQDKGLSCSFAEKFNKDYLQLKQRAWSSVLRSSEVLNRLSTSAQKKVESDFEKICLLEFTLKNIWGFLDGIVSQSSHIQNGMICDVFDKISRYHPNNRCYYQGWKSNANHRVNAFRIMMTRFILPTSGPSDYLYATNLSFDDRRKLSDIDKTFALLDGKAHETTFGLVNLFNESYEELSSGNRLSSDYFDVRFYPSAGTFHFFPRRKDLIDLLNRQVGKLRSWLPVDENGVSDEFWLQFNNAESISKSIKIDERSAWALMNSSMVGSEKVFEDLLMQHELAMKSKGFEYTGQDRIELVEQPLLSAA